MGDRKILPDNVKPVHYTLSLNDLDFKTWMYHGTVLIESQITRATTDIVLNALEIEITETKVHIDDTDINESFSSSNVSYDEKAQRAAIKFPKIVPASQRATIVIKFKGHINHDMAGFYRSKYKPNVVPVSSVRFDDEFYSTCCTQFQPTDARRAFPCFDEPNLKATFDFAIEVPLDQVVLSNMPVKDTKPTKEGWHMVTFERTPVMSTYLLAWAIGDFEYIERYTDRMHNNKQLPVRVYTTRGLKDQAEWAIEHASKVVDLFAHAFEIDYPLPKLDLLAVQEFTHGAMENWGLITYRTHHVLYDEATASPRLKNSIANTVSHEIAHQWFGNLVTMDWWDELWLNEGFATWAGWYAVNHLHPDWQVWSQFVNESMQSAFSLDSLRSSHAIQVSVDDDLDAGQIFDRISYAKGCSVIRMLANHLGDKTFFKGVAMYLMANKYGNATTDALWSSLSKASNQNISELMGSWIRKVGYPVVTVTEEPGQIVVKQSRFLSTGDTQPEDDATTWWIPLGLEGKRDQSSVSDLFLTQKEDIIRDIDEDFYKLNSNANSFFRISYPPSRLQKLATQLDRLSSEDKISTIGSAAALAESGQGTTTSLLTFVEGLGQESSTHVWSQLLDTLDTIKSVFAEDQELSEGLNSFINKLIDEKVKAIGWEAGVNDDYLTTTLRHRLIVAAIASEHPETTAEALKRFNGWARDPDASPIYPSLRGSVYRAGLFDKTNASSNVDILKKEWDGSRAVDGKFVVLSALGDVKDVDIIKDQILPFLFNASPRNNAVEVSDMHILANTLSDNPVGRHQQWEYIKANWGTVVSKINNPVMLDLFIRQAISNFTNHTDVAQVNVFFKDKDTSSYKRSLEQAKDNSRARAMYRERDTVAVKEWLLANTYM